MDARLGDTGALIASALPPLGWSLYELVKIRRVDAVSALVLAGIVFTLVATALGGSARLIQIRDALVTGLVGCVFLCTLVLKRPLIFYLARATAARNTPEGAAAFEALWEKPGARQTFRLLTLVWGAGLVAQTGLLCWLAWVLPISRYLLLNPFITYGSMGLMMLWSLWYVARRKALAATLLTARSGSTARNARTES